MLRLLDVGLEPLEALLDRAEVGQDQLQLQHLRVAQGVDRAVGVGHHVRLEGAHHVHQGVDAPQRGQVHEGRALALLHPGHVHVLDGGEVFFLGLNMLGQGVHPGVGHPGDARAAAPGAPGAAGAARR